MSLQSKTVTGVFWSLTERFSVQGVQFVISIFLARLLTPEDYGLIGMIAVFTAIAATLVNAGLTASLIRSKNLDEEDYSTVFLFNFGTSIIIYIIFFFSAPLIAKFYDQPALTNLVKVVSLSIIINAFSSIQLTRLTKALNFKKQFTIQLPSTMLAGSIGILMALKGFGVWSLVGYSLSGNVIKSAQLWIFSDWHPAFIFSFEKFKKHFSFGVNLAASSLLNVVFENSYKLVIGKFFTPASLGYYTRAHTFRDLPISNISTAISKVTLPSFAAISDDNVALKRAYRKVMQQVVFWLSPLLVGMIVLAEPLFVFMFKDKWLPAVPYFQLLAVTGILYPLNAYNINILAVKSRSDLILKLEIIKKILIAINLVAGILFGIYALLIGMIFTSVIAYFLNSFWSGKFINYSTLQQIKDFSPSLLISVLMGLLVWGLDLLVVEQALFLRLSIGGFTGTVFYLVISYWFKVEAFGVAKNLMGKFM